MLRITGLFMLYHCTLHSLQYGVRRGSMPEAGPMSQQPLTSHGLAHLNHQGAHAGMGSSMHPMYGYGHAQMSGGAFAGDGSHAVCWDNGKIFAHSNCLAVVFQTYELCLHTLGY